MRASGSVSDYLDTSDLQTSIARLARVSPSLVTIVITAGSVLVTATIAVPASAAAAVQTSLSSSLGTAAAASTALGITVESVPSVVVVSAPSLDGSGAAAVTADGESAGVALAASASALLLAALLAFGAYRWRKNLPPFDKGLPMWASFGRTRLSGSVLLKAAASSPRTSVSDGTVSARRPRSSAGSVSPGSPQATDWTL